MKGQPRRLGAHQQDLLLAVAAYISYVGRLQHYLLLPSIVWKASPFTAGQRHPSGADSSNTQTQALILPVVKATHLLDVPVPPSAR